MLDVRYFLNIFEKVVLVRKLGVGDRVLRHLGRENDLHESTNTLEKQN